MDEVVLKGLDESVRNRRAHQPIWVPDDVFFNACKVSYYSTFRIVASKIKSGEWPADEAKKKFDHLMISPATIDELVGLALKQGVTQ